MKRMTQNRKQKGKKTIPAVLVLAIFLIIADRMHRY